MRAVVVVVVVANSDRSEAVEHAARDTTRFSPTSILRNRSEETELSLAAREYFFTDIKNSA